MTTATTAPRGVQVNLAVSKIAPALMGGNTVVLKPPSQGAASAVLMSQTFVKAGIPPGVFNCVTGKGRHQPMLHSPPEACSVHETVQPLSWQEACMQAELPSHTGCYQKASLMA